MAPVAQPDDINHKNPPPSKGIKMIINDRNPINKDPITLPIDEQRLLNKAPLPKV